MDIICGTYQYGLYKGVPPKPLERLSQSIVFESLSLWVYCLWGFSYLGYYNTWDSTDRLERKRYNNLSPAGQKKVCKETGFQSPWNAQNSSLELWNGILPTQLTTKFLFVEGL